MGKDRKESRQFNISVEGINCEKMYFEHLARLINGSGENKYNIQKLQNIDSVRKAVCRAEQIVNNNYIEKKRKENYKGFQFFCDNPDVNVSVRFLFRQ